MSHPIRQRQTPNRRIRRAQDGHSEDGQVQVRSIRTQENAIVRQQRAEERDRKELLRKGH